jgi:hypothetical protein
MIKMAQKVTRTNCKQYLFEDLKLKLSISKVQFDTGEEMYLEKLHLSGNLCTPLQVIRTPKYYPNPLSEFCIASLLSEKNVKFFLLSESQIRIAVLPFIRIFGVRSIFYNFRMINKHVYPNFG